MHTAPLSSTPLRLTARCLPPADAPPAGDPTYLARFIVEGAVIDRNGEPAGLRISADALRDLAARNALVGAAMYPAHVPAGQAAESARTCAVVETATLVTLPDGRLALDGRLRFWPTRAGRRQQAHTDAWLAARAAGRPHPPHGLSLSVHVADAVRAADGALIVRRFGAVESVDFVHKPGAGGRILAKLLPTAGQGASDMNWFGSHSDKRTDGGTPANPPAVDAPPAAAPAALAALAASAAPAATSASAGTAVPAAQTPAAQTSAAQTSAAQTSAAQTSAAQLPAAYASAAQIAALALIADAGLPQPVALRLSAQPYADLAAAQAAVQQARAELAAIWAEQTVQLGARPARVEVHAIEAELRHALEWTFGLAGAPLPNPHLRRPANLYVAATGDGEWTGRIDLAAANTASLPALTADALNKVIIQQYDALAGYRWYEAISVVQPNDGSLHDMQWVQYGGQADLPTVAEGAAYTELTFGDTQESAAFVKYGGYIAVSEEAFRNSRLAELRAVPLQLANAAVMTRSAQFAAIFTANSGVGPTLAQDGKALFHSDHGNLYSGALSIAAWKAARILAARQAQIGSSKRLMALPRLCLVPIDLYDDALILFGYGAGAGGYPGTANNDVNPYALNRPNDPRPIVIPVPEWSDTNNWAWLADPALCPVVQVSYDGGDGRTHKPPQVVSVSDQRSGLVFSNDALPFKVKDRYAYGVSGYRGIGKSNVAGG